MATTSLKSQDRQGKIVSEQKIIQISVMISKPTCSADSDFSQRFVNKFLKQRDSILAIVDDWDSQQPASSNNTKGKVLSAARQMFSSKGFEATTMRNLADVAQIKAPALYNHFDSKEQILLMAVQAVLIDFFRTVLGSIEREQQSRWLEEILIRHTKWQLEHATLANANDILLQQERTVHHLPPGEGDRTIATLHKYVGLIRDLISQASNIRSKNYLTVTTFSIIAMCDRAAEWYRPEQTLNPEQISKHIWKLTERILSAPG